MSPIHNWSIRVRWADLLLSCLLWISVTYLCYLYVFFRLDLSDEGYWILVASNSNDLVANISGLVSHPLWILSFENLKVYRFVGFILSITSGAVFTHGLVLMTRNSKLGNLDDYSMVIKTLIYILPGAVFLLAMESSTPHYNSYVFWSITSAAGLIMISHRRDKESDIRFLWFLAGAILTIGALGKIFVLLFAFLIVLASPRRKMIELLSGSLVSFTILVLISSRTTNIVKDLLEQYRYYSVVSPGYSPTELIRATFLSIKYSIGGYADKIVNSLPLIILSILVILVCLLMGLNAFDTAIFLGMLLTIVASLVWFEESRNGSILLVIALLILLSLKLSRVKGSFSASSTALVITTLLVIPVAFAFGTTAGGFMPKWGYCSGIYITTMLILASRLYQRKKVMQVFFFLTSAIILGSQLIYTLSDSQHTGGSLLNRFQFVQAGNLGTFYVSSDQYVKFGQINYSMGLLKQEYGLNEAILFDLSEFQPLIGMSLGLKTPVIGLTLNSIGGNENEEQDIKWFDYANTIQQQVTSIDKPFILINKAFTNCDWEIKCERNQSLTMREIALAKYVIDYPELYEYVSTIGENVLLANKLRRVQK